MAGGGVGAGGGDGGGGDDDGRAMRFCTSCQKWHFCKEGWFILHKPGCKAEQKLMREKEEQKLARDRAQRIDNQRKKDRSKSKEENKKATAASKGKAENPKR